MNFIEVWLNYGLQIMWSNKSILKFIVKSIGIICFWIVFSLCIPSGTSFASGFWCNISSDVAFALTIYFMAEPYKETIQKYLIALINPINSNGSSKFVEKDGNLSCYKFFEISNLVVKIRYYIVFPNDKIKVELLKKTLIKKENNYIKFITKDSALNRDFNSLNLRNRPRKLKFNILMFEEECNFDVPSQCDKFVEEQKVETTFELIAKEVNGLKDLLYVVNSKSANEFQDDRAKDLQIELCELENNVE